MNMIARIAWLVAGILFVCSLTMDGYAVSRKSRIEKAKSEKFLIVGCGWNKVAVLDRNTEQLEWVHMIGAGEDCNDVELTRRNEVLYAYTGGARLVTLQQEVVWDYKVKPGEELFTATELSNGRYLLGICGHPARILELDKAGKVVQELTFETGISSVHNQFRQIVKTKKGNYIIALFEKGEVIEMQADGRVLRRVKTGGNPFCVKPLRKGHWLVGCGDAHKWVEIDLAKEIVTRTVHSDSLQGVSLLYVAEVHRYPNGNTLLANWNGHSRDKTQPKIVELDPQNRVVWCLKKDSGITNVSAIYPFFGK